MKSSEFIQLSAIKVVCEEVQLQVYEDDDRYDVMILSYKSDLKPIQLTKTGERDKIIAEAIELFEEVNHVSLALID